MPQAIDVVVDQPAVDLLARRVHELARSVRHRFGSSISAAEDAVGHQLHPMLTDLPIGFWTSASLLDLVGGRRARPAARHLIGAGVVCALPAAVSGLHDAADDGVDRRVVAVHASCNAAATVIYGWSWWARARGHPARGVVLGLVGATVATAGGLLGGQLAFGGDRDDDATGAASVEEQGIVDVTAPVTRPANGDVGAVSG
jgi:uncharacterized membrane protein